MTKPVNVKLKFFFYLLMRDLELDEESLKSIVDATHEFYNNDIRLVFSNSELEKKAFDMAAIF